MLNIYMYVYSYVRMYVCMHVSMCVCMYVYMYYVCVYMCVYICTRCATKTFRLVVSIVFFDAEGVIHREFVPEGKKVNAKFYVSVLDRFNDENWTS
jgi:hypothetical protein